jgi:hypothetical protein
MTEPDAGQGFRFDVAFSYASQDRGYVERVAKAVEGQLKVFYDRSYQVAHWGRPILETLERIYGRESRFCLIFISEHYARSPWTKRENRIAQSRALDDESYILPVRFDDTSIPGVLRTDHWFDLREVPFEEFVSSLMAKVRAAREELPREGVRPRPSNPPSPGYCAPEFEAFPALPVDDTILDPRRPLDVGSGWALCRGRYVHLLASHSAAYAHAHLEHVEFQLNDALAEPAPALPVRWWLRLELGPTPEMPDQVRSSEDLWPYITGRLAAWTTRYGLPNDVLPGFLVDADVDAGWSARGKTYVASLVAWVKCLLDLFGETSPALVVHLTGDEVMERDVAHRALGAQLRQHLPSVPVDLLKGTFFPRAAAAGLAASRVDDTARPGAHLLRWIEDAERRHRELSAEPMPETPFPALLEARRALVRQGILPFAEQGSASRLIEDLDRLADRPDELDRDLLRFVERFLPDRIHALIRACAAGARQDGRLAAARFAARAPHFMDQWVMGTGLDPARFPDTQELAPPPGEPPWVDALAMALARHTDHPGLLDRYRPFVDRQLLLPASAKRRIEALHRLSILEPREWWSWTSAPIETEVLRALLGLDPEHRAVFGLCTPREWEAIRREPFNHRQIIECRRGRALAFGPPGTGTEEAP